MFTTQFIFNNTTSSWNTAGRFYTTSTVFPNLENCDHYLFWSSQHQISAWQVFCRLGTCSIISSDIQQPSLMASGCRRLVGTHIRHSITDVWSLLETLSPFSVKSSKQFTFSWINIARVLLWVIVNSVNQPLDWKWKHLLYYISLLAPTKPVIDTAFVWKRRSSFFLSNMSFERFKFIKAGLRFDVTRWRWSSYPDSYCLWFIQYKTVQAVYIPSPHLTLDEQLIEFHGR